MAQVSWEYGQIGVGCPMGAAVIWEKDWIAAGAAGREMQSILVCQ
jgi:hypothetical protein